MNTKRFFAIMMLVVATVATMFAAPATWDDEVDDIYYNPAKEKAKKQKKQKRDNKVQNVVVDYPSADTYVTTTKGLDMSIDEYNRRGQFLVADTVNGAQGDSLADTYTYTRRIVRFHNGDIVNASGDKELIDSYYEIEADGANVYVIDADRVNIYYPYYGYRPWRHSVYWGNYGWNFGFGFYDPWYSWDWGWNCSWHWGWNWGWGPSWGYPPHHHHAWAPVFPHYGSGRPYWSSSHGSSRPHGAAVGGGSGSRINRPGAFSAGARNTMGSRRNEGVSSSRRNDSSGAVRPSNIGGNNKGSNNSGSSFGRGRNRSSNDDGSSFNQGSSSRRNAGSSFRSGGGGGSRGSFSGSRGGGGGRGRR